MKRSALLSLVCLCATLTPAFAHPQSDSTLYFALDYARFRINPSAAQVEIYLAVPRAQLRFLPQMRASG